MAAGDGSLAWYDLKNTIEVKNRHCMDVAEQKSERLRNWKEEIWIRAQTKQSLTRNLCTYQFPKRREIRVQKDAL